MKKITLLTFLLITGFGYSQTYDLLENFDTVTDGVTWLNDSGSTTSTVENTPISGTNTTPSDGNYGQIITQQTSAPWQAGALIMQDNYLDLANQRTIQVDVYSDTATFILAKAVGAVGGGDDGAADASHLGTGWETLTFDFDMNEDGPAAASADFSSLYFFPNWNGAGWDGDCNSLCGGTGPANSPVTTTLYDNLRGLAGGVIVPETLPSPAFNPSTPDANTFSINSDTGGYTSGFDYAGGCFGILDGEPDLDTGGDVNKALRFDFGVAGWGCTNSADVDVSTIGGMPIAYASFQYYTDDATDFYFDLISNSAGTTESFYYVGQSAAGGAPTADIALVQGSWQHVIIPISEFTNQTFDPTKLFQFKFDVFAGLTPGTVYIDNILLSSVSPTLGVETAELPQLNVYPNPSQSVWNVKTNNQTLNSIQVFDVLGKQVLNLKPNANSAVIDATNLSNGLYFAKINTDRGSSTLKLIKN